jgi:hypothetical protein
VGVARLKEFVKLHVLKGKQVAYMLFDTYQFWFLWYFMYVYINNKGVIPCVSRHCVVFCMVNVYIRENGMFLHVYIVVGGTEPCAVRLCATF